MSKKPQTNRKFEDIFDLANYLNYYFGKNPEAQVTMNDLKKIADNNPGLFAEEPTIVNSASRPVISDNQGHTIMLEMRPAFVVYEDEVEDGDPEEEEPDEYEDGEEEDEDSPEDSPEESEETEEDSESEPAVETDSEGREINRDVMEQFDWLKPGETFVWLDPDSDTEVPVVCDEIRSSTGKVQSDKTDIVVHRMNGDPEEKFSVFSDEIVMEEDEEDEEEEEDESEHVDVFIQVTPKEAEGIDPHSGRGFEKVQAALEKEIGPVDSFDWEETNRFKTDDGRVQIEFDCFDIVRNECDKEKSDAVPVEPEVVEDDGDDK